MKKILYCFKLFISGLLALIILSTFSLIYYNPPIVVPQPERITNNKYPSNTYYSSMLEGYGYGVTDSFGYNNGYYRNTKEPDIVFIGSSQLEALQVPQESNFVYLLNKKLSEDNISDNNLKCINLGISGHFFNISVSNFESVAEKYKDSKCIIIETSNVEFDLEEIKKMLNEEYSAELEERGSIYKLSQKVPYFRLLYKKISEIDHKPANNTDVVIKEKISSVEYEKEMNNVLKKISDISEKNGVKTMILFHNRIVLNSDNKPEYEDDKVYIDSFKKCCADNNIDFIDVTPTFISEFSKEYKMPYGYANTVPGKGHLNKYGHKIISEVLYTEINKIKEELNNGI